MGWRYYDFPKATPRPKPKPGKARKKFGNTWWGKKWVEVLSNYEYDQRMSRGRAYARADKVKNFKINKGNISATVKGSIGNYKVNIKIKKYNSKEWKSIIQKLSEIPIIIASLLNDEMSENISEVTGCSFIPDSFKATCSCPDYANPCKHIAAVFYTLADEIDYEPMILFKLRGMDKEKLFKELDILDESEAKQEKSSKKKKKIAKKKRKQKQRKKQGKTKKKR